MLEPSPKPTTFSVSSQCFDASRKFPEVTASHQGVLASTLAECPGPSRRFQPTSRVAIKSQEPVHGRFGTVAGVLERRRRMWHAVFEADQDFKSSWFEELQSPACDPKLREEELLRHVMN